MGELIQQVRQIWEKMDNKKRLLFGAGMLCLLIFFLVIIQVSKPKYELLYGNLQQTEQDEIIGTLREMNVPYRKEYSALYVPNASEVRAELMKAGIPKGGIIGWEIFDRTSLGVTKFQNTVNYQRALQDEIRRTLRQIEGVVDASVIITIPDNEPVFADEKQSPTASITLNLSRPNILTKSQVNAIVNFVAGSVIGMRPENVTIIDNFANELTMENQSVQSFTGSLVEQQLLIKKNLEQGYKRNIEAVLGRVFGLHNVIATVNINLNFDYQEIRKELYGDRGVPRSEQEILETYTGTGVPYGIPGTDSNITQYRIAEFGQESDYERMERIVNTEIDRVEEHHLKQSPTIERITVSVVIGQSLSASEIRQIEDSVAATVGTVAERGDRIAILCREFVTEPEPTVEEVTLAWQLLLLPGLFILLTLLMVLFFARRRRAQQAAQVDMVIDDALEETAVSGELSPEDQKRLERQEYIERLAKEDPQNMVALLRTWMTED